jgi:undecaprenyl diphosphate synthase
MKISPDIQDELHAAIQRTAGSRGMLFNIALNYGRAEIVDAARRAMRQVSAGDPTNAFASFLYTAGQPDPDLMIRTSGEMRVSNYLLWQIAHPRSTSPTRCGRIPQTASHRSGAAYQKRERRYGGPARRPLSAPNDMNGSL